MLFIMLSFQDETRRGSYEEDPMKMYAYLSFRIFEYIKEGNTNIKI